MSQFLKTDKLLHFLAGYCIADVSFELLNLDTKLIWISLVLSIIGGALKECFDKYIQNELFDYRDLFVTGLGGVAWTFTTLIR